MSLKFQTEIQNGLIKERKLIKIEFEYLLDPI